MMIQIFQFTMYDVSTDQTRKSRRWGTRAAIEALGGTVLEESATTVEASAINSDMHGLTEIGFDPRPRTGFQTHVTSNMRSN
jgi:hypothetical protein